MDSPPLTAALKTFGRNGRVRHIIDDCVMTSTVKFQARFQIRLELSENLLEIPLSWPQPHHRFYLSQLHACGGPRFTWYSSTVIHNITTGCNHQCYMYDVYLLMIYMLLSYFPLTQI